MTSYRFGLAVSALVLTLACSSPLVLLAQQAQPDGPSTQSFPPPFCSRFNINIDLQQSFQSVLFDRTDEAGIGGVRLWAWWKWMEPTQGNIDFTLLDQLVNAAELRGIKILITFASIPSWANGSPPNCQFWEGQCSAPPTDPAYFADFAEAVVSRYGTRVLHYEVWNEPNLDIFWDGPFWQYISEILVNGSNAIKTANLYAKVVGPSTVFSTSRFQQALNSACSSLDILSIHDYPVSAAQLFNHLDNQYLPIIQSSCNKPLWVTEFGIDSVDVGETVQAQELVAAYQGVVDRAYLDALFVYRIQDHAPWANPPIRLGIVRSEFEGAARKEAFWAIQSFTANASPVLCLK